MHAQTYTTMPCGGISRGRGERGALAPGATSRGRKIAEIVPSVKNIVGSTIYDLACTKERAKKKKLIGLIKSKDIGLKTCPLFVNVLYFVR